MKKNNKGFSLVELIIVIAIMAVLIGVLAAFRTAKTNVLLSVPSSMQNWLHRTYQMYRLP